MNYPLIEQRLELLTGQQVTAFSGDLYSTATLDEVSNEFVFLVDSNNTKSLFPINTLASIEWG